jgi:prepilin-type N-terminal cleavage/methylation domain-containing protein/prepilin-type processing-associated H-X9-DG protein
MRSSTRKALGFTLIELLVVIGIIAVLIGILMPAIEHARDKGYVQTCASNLRQIGLAISMYCNENKGNYPRTLYDPTQPLTTGTGYNAVDSFQPGGVAANDLTAAPYLLLKAEHLPLSIFICSLDDDTTYSLDTADPAKHSNFTDWTKNLSYSFANPYPTKAVEDNGYRLTSHLRADFAIAADLNPGKTQWADVTVAQIGASEKVNDKANSRNHEQDGQNILYADGHVSFEPTVLSGIAQDNIYTNQANQFDNVSPLSPTDSILLPHGN